MTLEQLRIFVAVAEKEHVTMASRELHLTQSATSAAIAALEMRYDVKLFDRIGRRIALTNPGRAFLSEARAVLARAKAAELTLNEMAGLKRGSLTIGASQTIGNYWLPPRIQKFQELYPGIKLQLRIMNTELVAAAATEGAIDLGFVEGQIEGSTLTITKIGGDFLVIVVGIKHPWAKQRKITPRLLTKTSWILREPGSGTRSMFDAALAQRGIRLSDLTIKLELPSNEAVRMAVENGGSATAISNLVVASSLTAGTLHQVQIDMPKRSFFLVRHKERYVSRAEKALFDLIETQ